MSGRFRVNTEELSATVDQMARFEQRLEAALADVDAKVNRMHASWSGAAAAEHQAAHQRWKQGAQEMRAAIVVMRGIASTAHQNYTEAATANTAMWSV